MPTPSYSIQCTKKLLVAPGVFELQFSKPEDFTFKAGQFVLFDVPLTENPSDIQPRAYSIASMPEEANLLFIIKLKPGGRASVWIEKILKEGDIATLKGPFGFFTLTQEPSNLIFACTGAGIAPFRSQILDALNRRDQRSMHLFFGVRSQSDFFWCDTFEFVQKKYSNFSFHPCLSGSDSSWQGRHGRVQQFIPSAIVDPLKTHLYICGAPAMVADIKKLALDSWTLEKKCVHAEGYI